MVDEEALAPSLSRMLLPLFRAILAFLFGSGGNDRPVVAPTLAPIITTSSPMASPPSTAPVLPTPEPVTFYAMADLPYSPAQAVKLLDYMTNLPSDAEFVIHLGDLRLAQNDAICVRSEYQDVATRLQASHAPVFVIVGDNDWPDCPNPIEGWNLWSETFVGFESEHWEHGFEIRRQNGRPENFSFVHKGSLFIGLNIVGGTPANATEWEVRLTQQLNWVKFLVRNYREDSPNIVGRVVIFGHANPNTFHNRYFFNGLRNFIRDELNNELPIAYMNGDQHVWRYNENWYGQSSWLRAMMSGNAVDLPTKVTVRANSIYQVPSEAFLFDRRLNA